ncbi:reactive mitochondrial oxygen species modulator 1-domain-containing protein [Terfezia claveryi]|nr:reactive mitochondrial oxygen species modulator 1-domain-containing protein [Terfezia claveryi]
MGFIFGGYTILKHGAGPNGVMRSLGQYMLGSAATFGFFMSIGTAIRTEGPEGTEKMRVYHALLQKAREERRAIPVVVMARPALSSRWPEERGREA